MKEPNSHPSIDRLLSESAWAWSLARSLARDAASADDAVQDVWLRALIRPPRLESGVHAARPWLSTVLRNAIVSRNRGERRREQRERDSARDERTPAVDRVLAREEARRQLVAAVVALPEHYREVILLRFFDGLSPGAIAERLGVPGSTVRTRLQRGLGVLRTQLEEQRDDRGCSALAILFLEMPDSHSFWMGVTLVKSKLVAVAVLCVLAWMVWWFAAGSGEVAVIATAAPDVVSASAATAEESKPAIEELSRTSVAAPNAPVPEPTRAARRLRVVDAETWQPIAGAIVRWADASEVPHELFPMGDDRDARVIELGHSTTSDALGWCEVPEPKSVLQLCGEAPGRFGRAYLSPQKELQQDLALTRDGALSIEVVDAHGNPQPDVHVIVACADPKLGRKISLRSDVRTGVVHFPHAMSDLFGGRPHGAMIVRAEIPHESAPELILAANPWPTQTLRLVVPESGSVRVTITEADGSALNGDALVTLVGMNPSKRSPKLRRKASNGPVVRFDHVGFGLDFHVAASPMQHSGSSWSGSGMRIVGPKRPGEVVDVKFALGVRPAEITGRALDSRGTPLVRRNMLAVLREGNSVDFRGNVSRFATDDDGRFVFTPDKHVAAGSADRLALRTDEGEWNAEFAWEGRTLDEPHDVGELIFEAAPLLVSGRVISTEGAPIAGASVNAMWRPVEPNEAQALPQLGYSTVEWDLDRWQFASTDAQGHFTMLANAFERRCALKVFATGYSAATDIEFEPGKEDLVIQLEPMRAIAGRLVASRPEVLARARVEVHGSSPTPVDPQGRFLVQTKGSAPVDVAVRIEGCAEPVVVVRGVQSTDDPRLLGLRLDEFVRCIEVSARDIQGEVVETFEVVWTAATDPSVTEVGFAGSAVIVTCAKEIALEVRASGYDEQSIDGVRENVEVQLAPGPYLLLRVPEATPMPPTGLSLSVYLQSDRVSLDLRAALVNIREREVRVELPARGRWTVRWLGVRGERGGNTGLEEDVLELSSDDAFGVSVLDLAPEELERRWAALR